LTVRRAGCYAKSVRTLILAALLAAAPVAAEELDFAPTRVVEGHNFAITGAGTLDKQYQMALYVDELDARRAFPALVTRAGGKTKAKILASDHAQQFILWGHFEKLAEVRFTAPMAAADLQKQLKDVIDLELGEKVKPDLRKLADALLSLFDRDVEPGQTLLLRTDDAGHIDVELAGHKKSGPQSPKLARALWGVWLGDKPVSKELSRALVDKLDLLGR
jgi:hypothetical protein